MWAALRSDLTEFVSTVREDATEAARASSTVLSNIDSKLSSGEYNESSSEENSNVLIGDDGELSYVDGPAGFEKTGIVLTAADEVSRLKSLEETYVVPLLPGEEQEGDDAREADETTNPDVDSSADDAELESVREFLDTFEVSSKTEEIASILEDNPKTVKLYFEKLVPTVVSYEQFWLRYYYRCDEDRVQRAWDASASEARIARQKAISSGIESVKSIFGGAAKALGVNVSTEAPPTVGGSSTYEKYQAKIDQHRKRELAVTGSGLGVSLFGASGRPPFVMNTAVSDVDESAEDEDEELGWSDDDDNEEVEEDEDDEENEDDENEESEEAEESKEDDSGTDEDEEQIDFTSPNKDILDDLRKQVAQAEEERDQLHETVEMQAREIASLRRERVGDIPNDSFLEDVQKLKMELFERDSEIAALKASFEDNHGDRSGMGKTSTDDVLAMEHELKQMKLLINAKENEIERLKDMATESESVAKEMKEKWDLDKKALGAANVLVVQLRSEIEDTKRAAAQSLRDAEDKYLSNEMLTAKEIEDARQEIQRLQSELLESKMKAETERLRLDMKSAQYEKKEQRVNLTGEVEEALGNTRIQEPVTLTLRAVDDNESNRSSSMSSAVKIVTSPKQSPVTALEDDDDWGDSWGDED